MSFGDFLMFMVPIIGAFLLGTMLHSSEKENIKVFHSKIMQENGDFLKIEANGHYYWVIYAGHAEDCPCGEGGKY